MHHVQVFRCSVHVYINMKEQMVKLPLHQPLAELRYFPPLDGPTSADHRWETQPD